MGVDEIRSIELDAVARFLSSMLASCQVWPDGTVIETKEQVARISGVIVRIHFDEHSPPHFHAECSGRQASYTIEKCVKLAGNLGVREERIVKYWFRNVGQPVLNNVWKRTRPGQCSIGRYNDAMDK